MNEKVHPLLLAYLGDSVMEVMIRKRLILRPGADPASCNREALEYVTAARQADAARRLVSLFDPEEAELFGRARNAKANSVPRSADLYSYRLATALEAVFAFNSLAGRDERNEELLRAAYPSLFEDAKDGGEM